MDNLLFATAMHGRLNTVAHCMDSMPEVRRMFVYTNTEDHDLVKGRSEMSVYCANSPLSHKWNSVIKNSRSLDFEGLVILGSDDFVDQAFIDFVSHNIKQFDFIGFTDMYFQTHKKQYYWKGYENEMKGLTIGAGRCYSRSFLERLDFNLYDITAEKGLDSMAWNKIKNLPFTKLITTLKENDLYMVDVKDSKGMTSIKSITNLIEHNHGKQTQKD